MPVGPLSSLMDQVREFFLLERAEKAGPALEASRLSDVRGYHDAGVRRLRATRDLRGLGQTPLALSLYRDSALLFAAAFLSSRGEAPRPDGISTTALLDQFTSALAARSMPVAPEIERVKPLFSISDPLEFDRIVPDEARRAADDLDVLTVWLAGLVDPRSPAEFRNARYRRIGSVAVALLAAILGVTAWALKPRNLARHRPVTSSSVAFDTKPEGAVDGENFSRFGFHSNQEESPWLAIDLGQRYEIRRIKIYGRGDCCFDQSVPLALEVSDDGTAYREVAERKEEFSQSKPWVVEPSSLVTRFVRLRTKRLSYLVLSEVEVYGRAAK